MKYTVVGPRLLVKVKKYTQKKDQTFEGSMIVMPEETAEMETINQSKGVVVQVGNTAYKHVDSGCDGTPWVKEGDTIHFSKYGAVRLDVDKQDSDEFWVLMAKDVLAVENS